ncbi:TPA: alkaline shock response membrane anchor protein AmaP [Streptococcus pyogenes]|nr:alkaline shock response membrane anchor protein AmaP [Streptococcus pyogenes]
MLSRKEVCMSKLLKISYCLVGLVLLSVFGWVVGITGGYIYLPYSYRWLSWGMDSFPNLLDSALSYYYFWTALVLFVITFLTLLVIILYPRIYTEVQLRHKNKKGTLLLKKSAIESYVTTAIQTAGLMPNPTVTAKLYKRKFKIIVKGRLASRVAVADQISGVKEGIEKGLTEFFGINYPVNFKVYVKDIADSDRKHITRNRVE